MFPKKTFVSNIPTPAGMHRCQACNRVTRNPTHCEGCLAKVERDAAEEAARSTGYKPTPNIQVNGGLNPEPHNTGKPVPVEGRRGTKEEPLALDERCFHGRCRMPGCPWGCVWLPVLTICGQCKGEFDFSGREQCPGCGAVIHHAPRGGIKLKL